MCVIVDTCCISKVFNKESKDHARFTPILSWINGRHGRLIFGGSKYKKELAGMKTFLGLLVEYERQGKLVRLKDSEVDAFASWVRTSEASLDFDDEHLIGMVAVSHCRIVCTDDKRAIPYLTRKSFYEKVPMKPPKIYSQKRHGHLCAPKSIAPICR